MTSCPEIAKGRLDGLNILRFAHAYESGGGVEQYLADLNRELSKRNRLTIIQMHLTFNPDRIGETEQKIGESLLIKVPLLVQRRLTADPNDSRSTEPSLVKSLRQYLLNLFLCTPSINNLVMKHFMGWRKIPRRHGEPDGAGAKADEIIRRFKVDLVVLHTSGGADASEIIGVAKSARVPVAIVHHFSNDRLGGVSLRQQISCVDGVAGASWIGVPNYLRKRFWNLSDAVDTEFFRLVNVRPLAKKFFDPVLYTPARVTPEKGQADVIEVASILKRRGLEIKVLFAGRVDSPDFEAHLRQIAEQRNLSSAVEFLGPLSIEEYRDWYGAARVMVMPTRHHEGMPRTLIDSQAMKVPPVVYNIGGTREGVKDKETGYLVRLGDVDAVAKAVETLIRNSNLHRCMGEAGRKFVEENFSLQAFAERHENFYSHVLGTSRGQLNH